MSELHWTEVGRNGFSLIRDTALIGLLGGLIFYPAAVGARLDEAGIVKGSAFGLEFERKVEAAKKQSEAALIQTEQAQSELQKTGVALDKAREQIQSLEQTNPELAGETAEIKAGLENSAERVDQVQVNISKTLAKQQQAVDSQSVILQRVQASVRR